MRAQSQFKTIVIPASASLGVNVTGTSFYIKNTSGLVDINVDDNTTLRCDSGLTFDCPPGDYFKRLIFTNPDTVTSITVTFYAGTLSVGTRTPGVFTKPAPSYGIFKQYTVTSGNDTVVDVTNLRSGKMVVDSRQYIVLTWSGVGTDAIAINSAAGGASPGVTLGPGSGGISTVRIDSPMALWLRGVLGATTYVQAMAFYNYDS